MVKSKGVIRISVNTLILITPFLFLFLPADYFDMGESFCPSKRFLDIECLGCGITRAIQHAIHFDFKTAWSYNPLFVIVIPVAIYYWFRLLFSTIELYKSNNIY